MICCHLNDLHPQLVSTITLNLYFSNSLAFGLDTPFAVNAQDRSPVSNLLFLLPNYQLLISSSFCNNPYRCSQKPILFTDLILQIT